MASELETSIVKISGFKAPKEGYPDRQDHLAALARLANKLNDKAWLRLSDEATSWVNAAIRAINAKDEIKDFDVGAELEEAEAEEPVAEAAEADEDTLPDDEPEEQEAEVTEEAAEPEEQEAEAEEPPKSRMLRKKFDMPSSKYSPTRLKNREARIERGKQPAMPIEKAQEIAKKLGHKKPTSPEEVRAMKKVRIYTNLTGEKDRFGVVMGTKAHDAVMMYEKGCTSIELRRALEGRFYNILRELERRGHRVERQPGGVFKLTHIDDVLADNLKKARKK